jgi:hypothetical protein
MKLTTINVRGQDFAVHVTDEGKFFSELDGARIDAASLDELRTKLARATLMRNKKLAIPIIEWHEGKMRRGVCTGRHAANQNLLVKWEGQAKGSEQTGRWNSDTFIDPTVEAEYAELCQADEAAGKACREFEKKHTVDVNKLVNEAYAAAEAPGGAA